MILAIDAFSDTGCVREHNEDMVLVQGELIRDDRIQLQIEPAVTVPFVVAVADGMGGHNGGEFASELAVQGLDDFSHSLAASLSSEDLKLAFDTWIQDIHQFVVNKGNEIPEFKNMGTTLVGILLYDNKIFWMNVGDSRLYRFRGGILSQISTDHSMREMFDPTAPSNMICNSIGAGNEVFIDFVEITDAVFDEDLFILCSDGLNDMIPDDQIESLLEQQADSAHLIETAKQNGGKDNVSVALIRFKNIEPDEPIVAQKEKVAANENPETKLETSETARTELEIEEQEVEKTTEKKMFAMKEEKKQSGFFDKLGKLLK